MGIKNLAKWIVRLGDGSTIEMDFGQSDRTFTNHRYFPVIKDGPSVHKINKTTKTAPNGIEQLWSISGHRRKK